MGPTVGCVVSGVPGPRLIGTIALANGVDRRAEMAETCLAVTPEPSVPFIEWSGERDPTAYKSERPLEAPLRLDAAPSNARLPSSCSLAPGMAKEPERPDLSFTPVCIPVRSEAGRADLRTRINVSTIRRPFRPSSRPP